MKIGIFDSGIGGLSVLHRAMKMMPNVSFVYYADTEHVPYGEKTVQQIREFDEHNLNFLIDQGVDAVVIACNTATSVATKEFRAGFPVPIVGMEPAVKKAVEQYCDTGKRILVAATPITIASDKLHNLLERVDKEHDVDLLPLPKCDSRKKVILHPEGSKHIYAKNFPNSTWKIMRQSYWAVPILIILNRTFEMFSRKRFISWTVMKGRSGSFFAFCRGI